MFLNLLKKTTLKKKIVDCDTPKNCFQIFITCHHSGCSSRFTHANRHCSDHPCATLVRVGPEVSIKDLIALREQETNSEVREWLQM